MKEVSNNTIISLLAVAVVITLIGTSISLVNIVGDDGASLTGAATSQGTGTSNVSVESVTEITNNRALLNFGSGYVASNCSKCVMSSNNGFQENSACCVGFNNVSTGFILENTGNVNVSLNYTCSGNCTAADAIGGTNPGLEWLAVANSVAGFDNETGTLDTAPSCKGSFNITAYENVRAAGDWICGNMSNATLHSANTEDAVVFNLNLTIPNDAPAGDGVKNTTFTFTATS